MGREGKRARPAAWGQQEQRNKWQRERAIGQSIAVGRGVDQARGTMSNAKGMLAWARGGGRELQLLSLHPGWALARRGAASLQAPPRRRLLPLCPAGGESLHDGVVLCCVGRQLARQRSQAFQDVHSVVVARSCAAAAAHGWGVAVCGTGIHGAVGRGGTVGIVIHQQLNGEDVVGQLLQLSAGLCQLRVRLQAARGGGPCRRGSVAGNNGCTRRDREANI